MSPSTPAQPALGVLIRFRDSARTLPGVLAALRTQTLQPDLIVGVDNGSQDASAELLLAAGGVVVPWAEKYHHAEVLNFGLRHCPAERVLILSSHTVLHSPDALARLNAALDDPATACASGKSDADRWYSDAIDWAEIQQKGLKLGSIYSNSFGLIRRSFWEELPFEEGAMPNEDYIWAVEQLRRGRRVRRVNFEFSYRRSGQPRNFLFSSGVFGLAARYGLDVRWLGRRATLQQLLRGTAGWFQPGEARRGLQAHVGKLCASLFWRLAA